MCYSRTARIKKCPQAAPGYERPRQEVFVLPWLLIVWRLVACGAAGYRVPDMHHLRWTPRKAAQVPKQSRYTATALSATESQRRILHFAYP